MIWLCMKVIKAYIHIIEFYRYYNYLCIYIHINKLKDFHV